MSDTLDFRFDDVEDAITPAAEEKVEAVEAVEEDKADEDYLAIYDSIMFEDSYEEKVPLGKRYSAMLRTRSVDDDGKISRQMDGMNIQTMQAMQHTSAILALSYSLVELNGKNLRDMKVSERHDFILSKSSHLIEQLSKHMVKFDQKVRSALEYGEENF